MSTSTHTQPSFPEQTGTEYKTAIDDSIAVQKRVAAPFAAHEQSTPDMTVRVDAGHVFDGSTLTEVAAQNTGTITAPSTSDRIDRIVISNTDGTVSVITGSEAASPSAPSITSGNLPCAKVYLTPSTTEITNADITDERSRLPGGVSGGSVLNTQNDGPLYTGWVDGEAATPFIMNGPSGWSITDNGTGNYTITHNLGLSDEKKLLGFINAYRSPGFVALHAVLDPNNDSNNAVVLAFDYISGDSSDTRFQFMFINMEET